MLRVYAERSHYSEAHRSALNDIVKAFWNDATSEERKQRYGNRTQVFEVVEDPAKADVHLLTMRWQHYVEQGRTWQALAAVDLARANHKPIAVFSLSDFEANFPVLGTDIHLFQVSAYRSRKNFSNHAIPAFIDDPTRNFRSGQVEPRHKSARPTVGFCGQAGSSLPRHAFRWLRNRYRQVRWRFGMERWEPPPLEHTWFRQHVLDVFASDPAVAARYVLRTRYRAGLSQAKDRNDPVQQARRDFLENVADTDFTVCMRGGGNFSIRFYEALALGRIPIFIDTDCVLPFHDRVNWRELVVWVDEHELRSGPAKVAGEYARMSDHELVERQLACRALWTERLTADGFYRHFHEHFPELAR